MSESLGLVSVSREALNSDTDSNRLSPIDDALEARFRERCELVYDTPIAPITHVDERVALQNINTRPGNTVEDYGAEEHEFRLFSGPNKRKAGNSDGALQRIAIRSPTPVCGDPKFVVARRPDSYYFTGPLNGVRAEQIAAAAISGKEILMGLDLRWRGCELPWRVTVIRSGPLKSSSKSIHGSHPTANSTKKRIGKKRRIANRKKKQAIEEKNIATRRGQAEREAVDKEKRTRKNREKKVKRKLKEKMEKMKRAEEVQDAD